MSRLFYSKYLPILLFDTISHTILFLIPILYSFFTKFLFTRLLNDDIANSAKKSAMLAQILILHTKDW